MNASDNNEIDKSLLALITNLIEEPESNTKKLLHSVRQKTSWGAWYSQGDIGKSAGVSAMSINRLESQGLSKQSIALLKIIKMGYESNMICQTLMETEKEQET